MSAEHFTVDGTLIEAWASLKSFRKKGEKPEDRPPPDDRGNSTVNFHGEKRSNATHESTTDPDARLARKGNGKESKLSYSGHVLMENRNGLCVDLRVAPATGYAERDEALETLRRLRRRGEPTTLGGDNGYCLGDFPQKVLDLGIKPHLAVPDNAPARSRARRFTRSESHKVSQRRSLAGANQSRPAPDEAEGPPQDWDGGLPDHGRVQPHANDTAASHSNCLKRRPKGPRSARAASIPTPWRPLTPRKSRIKAAFFSSLLV